MTEGLNYKVAELNPDDHQIALIRMFGEMYRHFAQSGPILMPREDGAEIWARNLKSGLGRSRQMFGAVQSDSDLVGFIEVQLAFGPEFLANRLVGRVNHIHVNEEHRRSGIARRLADCGLSWLFEHGAAVVQAQIVERNEHGSAFWRSLGFQEELRQLRLDPPDRGNP